MFVVFLQCLTSFEESKELPPPLLEEPGDSHWKRLQLFTIVVKIGIVIVQH
jgi:hypothetical protein